MKYILAGLLTIFSTLAFANEVHVFMHHDASLPESVAYSIYCTDLTYSQGGREYLHISKAQAEHIYNWLTSHKTCSTIEVLKSN